MKLPKISGPASFNIINPNAVQTLASNLVQGVYQFKLKVTDGGSLSDNDTVIVTVLPATTNPGWTYLSFAPVFFGGSEDFIIGIDMDNVFIGDGYSHLFFKYNYQTNSWIQKANVPGQAYDRRVNFAVNGKGYSGMGIDLNTPHNEMYQYNPVTDQWIQKNNSPLSGHAIPMQISNHVYLIDGPNLWVYDPLTDSYTQKNNIPSGAATISFVINGTGYIVTGNAQCWKYNATSDNWQQKASLPGYLGPDAGFTLNNYGYVLGDSSGASYNLNHPLHLWRYDPMQDQWQRTYNDYYGGGKYFIKTVSLNGLVYAGFGFNNGDIPWADFWKFH